MSHDFIVEATSELTFDWVLRHFNKLADLNNKEGSEIAIVHLVFADSPYTVQEWDHTILADTAGGAITINLAGGEDERDLRIKNIATSGANAVTVTPAGADDYDRTGGNITLAAATLDAVHILYSEQEANWFSL